MLTLAVYCVRPNVGRSTPSLGDGLFGRFSHAIGLYMSSGNGAVYPVRGRVMDVKRSAGETGGRTGGETPSGRDHPSGVHATDYRQRQSCDQVLLTELLPACNRLGGPLLPVPLSWATSETRDAMVFSAREMRAARSSSSSPNEQSASARVHDRHGRPPTHLSFLSRHRWQAITARGARDAVVGGAVASGERDRLLMGA